jgi:hypothetical protein
VVLPVPVLVPVRPEIAQGGAARDAQIDVIDDDAVAEALARAASSRRRQSLLLAAERF